MSHRPGRPHAPLAALAALAALAGGCAREPAPAAPEARAPLALPVRVLADSGRSVTLAVTPPPAARVWVARVSPARAPLAPPLPEPAPDTSVTPEALPAAPALAIDPGLKPPILREAVPLRLPAGLRGQSVELDVRVAEDGSVTEARWASGSRDPRLIEAAGACARAMRFYPALRGERPVAVWCRQRFDVARAAAGRAGAVAR